MTPRVSTFQFHFCPGQSYHWYDLIVVTVDVVSLTTIIIFVIRFVVIPAVVSIVCKTLSFVFQSIQLFDHYRHHFTELKINRTTTSHTVYKIIMIIESHRNQNLSTFNDEHTSQYYQRTSTVTRIMAVFISITLHSFSFRIFLLVSFSP